MMVPEGKGRLQPKEKRKRVEMERKKQKCSHKSDGRGRCRVAKEHRKWQGWRGKWREGFIVLDMV